MKPEDGGLPGLSAEVVQEWSAEWNDVGLWDDVLVLANRFWSAPEADRAMAWHHLLLAVGNFKRPGGTRLHLKLSGPPPENAYPESMKIPGIGCVIVFENAGAGGASKSASKRCAGSEWRQQPRC